MYNHLKTSAKGVFTLEDAKDVHWCVVAGGQVLFASDDNFDDTLTDYVLSDAFGQKERNKLFDQILASMIQNSRKPDAQSAAVGISESGEIYASVNTLEADEMHKDCAEHNTVASVLAWAKEVEGKEQASLSELHYMVKMGSQEYATRENLHPKTEKMYPPCGKCCDSLGSVSNEKTRIYGHWPHDGSIAITGEATGSMDDPIPGKIWNINVKKYILPIEIRVGAEDELAKSIVDEGIKGLTEGTQTRLDTPLKANSALDSINTYLAMQVGYRHSISNGDADNTKVECAVVRFSDGTFDHAMRVVGPNHNAQPNPISLPAFSEASSKKDDHKTVTDVFWMQYDPKDPYQMAKFERDALERLYKRRAGGGQDHSGESVDGNDIKLHIIPFNYGNLSTAGVERIMQSMSIKDLYMVFAGSKHESALNLLGRQARLPTEQEELDSPASLGTGDGK